MDASLPINPWGVPWSLFLLCLIGRLLGNQGGAGQRGREPGQEPGDGVAVHLVGPTRILPVLPRPGVARGHEATGAQHLRDRVYPDLVFTLPADSIPAPDPLAVGVGVMAYYGGNEDRDHAGQVYAAYLAKMESFAGWLIDSGGASGWSSATRLTSRPRTRSRPRSGTTGPGSTRRGSTATPVTTYAELEGVIASVATLVATRFHSVLFALKLGKPTISVGYSPKNDSLMADLGLGEYTQHVKSLDVAKLKEQFTQAENQAPRVRELLAEMLPERAEQARAQLDELSRVLF